MKKADLLQKEYYNMSASNYDGWHLENDIDNEHSFALNFLSAIIKKYNIKSVLDVGAGTGRAISYLLKEHPNIRVIGIEPVESLREIAYSKGILREMLLAGDGYSLDFNEKQFDLVCEFGVLHHVDKPNLFIAEMLRVSKKVIFISDFNNFGSGNKFERIIKQTLHFLGLWKVLDWIKNGGKNYHYSEGDGVAYSYSVFNNFKQIEKASNSVHVINTNGISNNHYRKASHIALCAIKK